MTDHTSGTVVVRARPEVVMGVIADFPAYPDWAGMTTAEVVGENGPDGRARLVLFGIDAGFIRDQFVLRYSFDGDDGVSWELTKPSAMLTKMTGSYLLAGRDDDTEVTFQLTVGLRVPIIGLLRRKVERAVIGNALSGLKTRAESGLSG